MYKLTRFRTLLITLLVTVCLANCKEQKKQANQSVLIGTGQMPNITIDNSNHLCVVYGSGDSILFATSGDAGKTFSVPALVAVLPQLAASHMRGPQIVATTEGLIIIACNKAGNIFSYSKQGYADWLPTGKLNDMDTVAKEGFMAIQADGQNAFAAWLDLRGNKKNKIVGAASTDGGKTWSKNKLIYVSPDSSVCECCKPSIAVKGENIFVLFRNWLKGNRDLYVIQSADGGNTFGEAKQLGNNHWTLNGCPMDGGGIVLNDKSIPETVWRRKDSIYTCRPGEPEIAIATGRGCTIESVNGKNVYAWTENGEIIIRKPQGIKINLGKGQLPLIKKINNEQVVCVWENDKQIHTATVSL